MGRKLGATPRFGKAGKRLIIVVPRAFCVHLPGSADGGKASLGSKKPGPLRPGSFAINTGSDQAAGFYEARVVMQGTEKMGGVPIKLTVTGPNDAATIYAITEITTRLPLRTPM